MTPFGNVEFADSKFITPSASCLALLTHWDLRAASRAACTAGSSSAISTAMIAMTTSNSISVKPRRCLTMVRGSNRELFGVNEC